MVKNSVLSAAAVALLALPCAATAAQPLAANGIPVDPSQSVSGHFDAVGTQNWRVYLQQGRYYAVSALSDGNACPRVAVTAAGGRTLLAFDLDGDNGSDEGAAGGSFRAPYTGLYAVNVTAGQGCAGSYSLTAARDCPGDRSTGCALTVGRPIANLHTDDVQDVDTFRATLRAGIPYKLTLGSSDAGCDFVKIEGPRGFVASDSDGNPISFTAPSTGTYYVTVDPALCEGFYEPWYSLSLVAARP